ncbi:uncharacterized protein LOC121374011 [Gigantopelta aegis]|uniref:uncharacterized protein LOC121374011 n=1 Tax=Gigantopelta aegis TaxID=1735272 RepID=UPI001B88D281|nr:uncharacterized protein LOC121374011 [Gigantopelta aegis]
MVPVAFALMPNRTSATYVRLFNQLSSVVEEKTGFDLSPEVVQTDFEIAAIQAIEEIFPDADTRGCLFHFSQCMLRKVQGLGLMRLYRADQGVQTLVRRAASLPLLPIDHVQDVWIDIMNERPDHLPHETEFTDYVTTTWVDDDSLFKVAMWNQHGSIGPRTNNHLEGWHSKLNRSLTKAHPNIYEFINKLKDVEEKTRRTLIQLDHGAAPVPRKRVYRDIDTRLMS